MEGIKIGDRIYQMHGELITYVHIVDRLTKTTVITKFGHKFSHSLKSIPYPRFERYDYKLETPELLEKLKKQNLVNKLRKFENYEELSIEQLKAISEIIYDK